MDYYQPESVQFTTQGQLLTGDPEFKALEKEVSHGYFTWSSNPLSRFFLMRND